MILHLVSASDWEAGAAAGELRPASLASEGFVHCSTPAQITRVANAFYAGRADLVLLVLDETRLDGLVWEGPIDPTSGRPDDGAVGDGPFPHLYAPLPAGAVVATLPYQPGPDGRFGPPPLR